MSGRNKIREPLSPEVRLSKALSYTLRHGAQKEGLAMRNDGYVNAAELVRDLPLQPDVALNPTIR
jgi:2'-phosphotransferase